MDDALITSGWREKTACRPPVAPSRAHTRDRTGLHRRCPVPRVPHGAESPLHRPTAAGRYGPRTSEAGSNHDAARSPFPCDIPGVAGGMAGKDNHGHNVSSSRQPPAGGRRCTGTQTVPGRSERRWRKSFRSRRCPASSDPERESPSPRHRPGRDTADPTLPGTPAGYWPALRTGHRLEPPSWSARTDTGDR